MCKKKYEGQNYVAASSVDARLGLNFPLRRNSPKKQKQKQKNPTKPNTKMKINTQRYTSNYNY